MSIQREVDLGKLLDLLDILLKIYVNRDSLSEENKEVLKGLSASLKSEYQSSSEKKDDYTEDNLETLLLELKTSFGDLVRYRVYETEENFTLLKIVDLLLRIIVL